MPTRLRHLALTASWRMALLHFAITLAATLGIGLLIGRPALLVALLFLGYLCWHLFHVFRLHRWLRSNQRLKPPEGWGIWSDIFDAMYRRQAESRHRKQRLLASLSQIKTATNALPDGILLLDPKSRLLWFNPAAASLLGLERPRDLGAALTGLVRSPLVTAWLEGLVDEPEGIVIDAPASPRRKLRLRIFGFTDDQRLLVVRDITAMQRAETMRKDFVANVSHELRTPLTVISGYVETMGDEVDPSWAPILTRIEEQARRMRALVEDLLTLSQLDARQELDEESAVDIAPMIQDVANEAIALSDGRHTIEIESLDKDVLRGNARDLRSAFLNLASNAVRYTPSGGRIGLRWDVNRALGEARFTVEDNGPGIAPKHLPRLTERFYRVASDRSRATGGTGLGLAIVKHVLALHDGRLEVHSEPGEGSTFSCVFPTSRLERSAGN